MMFRKNVQLIRSGSVDSKDIAFPRQFAENVARLNQSEMTTTSEEIRGVEATQQIKQTCSGDKDQAGK